jgi:hypothetical protein
VRCWWLLIALQAVAIHDQKFSSRGGDPVLSRNDEEVRAVGFECHRDAP